MRDKQPEWATGSPSEYAVLDIAAHLNDADFISWCRRHGRRAVAKTGIVCAGVRKQREFVAFAASRGVTAAPPPRQAKAVRVVFCSRYVFPGKYALAWVKESCTVVNGYRTRWAAEIPCTRHLPRNTVRDIADFLAERQAPRRRLEDSCTRCRLGRRLAAPDCALGEWVRYAGDSTRDLTASGETGRRANGRSSVVPGSTPQFFVQEGHADARDRRPPDRDAGEPGRVVLGQ